MAERPILFSPPMVRAILAGTKVQTRRIVKPQPELSTDGVLMWGASRKGMRIGVKGLDVPPGVLVRCPYGVPGDRLWVRETWNRFDGWQGFFYAADHEGFGIGPDDDPDHIPDHEVRWRPSIHMPRAASRITLEVTAVRVERLQDISIEDAKAEGAWGPDESIVGKVAEYFGIDALGANPRLAFRMLWEQINGPGSWDANPWVWVVEFKRA